MAMINIVSIGSVSLFLGSQASAYVIDYDIFVIILFGCLSSVSTSISGGIVCICPLLTLTVPTDFTWLIDLYLPLCKKHNTKNTHTNTIQTVLARKQYLFIKHRTKIRTHENKLSAHGRGKNKWPISIIFNSKWCGKCLEVVLVELWYHRIS